VPSFNLLRYRHHDGSVFLYAFDLIELNGDDLRREPLQVREATLASIVAKAAPGVRLNEHIEADGPSVCDFEPTHRIPRISSAQCIQRNQRRGVAEGKKLAPVAIMAQGPSRGEGLAMPTLIHRGTTTRLRDRTLDQGPARMNAAAAAALDVISSCVSFG
jgi:hypothetical protein